MNDSLPPLPPLPPTKHIAPLHGDWFPWEAEYIREYATAYARAAVAALTEAVGWKLVPVEPTTEMIEAGRVYFKKNWHDLFTTAEHYRVMLASAPTIQPTQPVQEHAKDELSFNCTNGCGACGVKLVDFVTHATQAQDGGPWVTVQSEPQIVSTCCGSPVEVWDERKQDIVSTVKAVATPAQAGDAGEPSDGERLDAELWRLAVRKGIVTLHSDRIDDRNQHTRCSWMQGHDKACDISNSAHDAATKDQP